MSGIKPFGVFAIFTALGALVITSAAVGKDFGDRPHEGGAVVGVIVVIEPGVSDQSVLLGEPGARLVLRARI